MLDQVFVSCAFGLGRGNQFVDHFPLVEAGEDEPFFDYFFARLVLFALFLQMDETAQDIEPGFPLQNLLPKGSWFGIRSGWVDCLRPGRGPD